MLNKLFFIFLLSINIYAKDIEKNYDEIFYYMQYNGIVIEEDVPLIKLFDMIESGKIYDSNGNINNKVLKIKIDKLVKNKNKIFSQIRKEINKNPNHAINKEVTRYLDDNNAMIEEKQNELKEKNDSWQTNIINYVLDLMKF